MGKPRVLSRGIVEHLEPRCVMAAGDLDPTFGGGDGVAAIDQFARQLIETGEAVAVQADGKILLAGSATDGFGRLFPDLLLVRLNADGSRDTSFGVEGQVTLDFGGDYYSREEAFAVAVQADGKIVVAGRAAVTNTDIEPLDFDFALARFTSAGGLDTSFGTGGFVRTDLGSRGDAARGLALGPGGVIYAVGDSGGDAAVARYTSSGALDASFDTDGKLVRDLGGADSLRGAVVQSDGKLVAAGTTALDFAAVRFTTTGALDAMFGTAGVALVDFGNTGEEARAVALDATGRVVLGGGVRAGTANDFALTRLTTAGVLDSTFGTGGKVTFDVAINATSGGQERIEGLALQADGKIIVGGTAPGAFNRPQWAAARVDANGTLDGSFGTGGITRLGLDVATLGRAAGVALTGGQLVIVGTRQSDNALQPYSLGAMKLTTGGVLDTSFDGDGVALFDARGSADNSVSASTVLADGSVLLAEELRITPRNSLAGALIAVTHLLPDGSRDPGFGTNGTVTVDLGQSASRAFSIAQQPDGKILLAGERYFLPAPDAALTGEAVLARLNADGTIDATFGTTGIATERLFGEVFPLETRFEDLVLLPDGKIVVLSNGINFLTGGATIAMSRYNANGTIDTTFAGDGRAEISIAAALNSVTTLEMLPDGKFLLAGTDETNAFTFARLNADGAPDATFGVAGVKTLDLKGAFSGVIVNGDGTLRVGVSTASNGVFTPTVLGLATDGSFDLTFGNGGVLASSLRSAQPAGGFAQDAAGRFLFTARIGDSLGQRVDLIFRFGADGKVDHHFGSYTGIEITDASLSYVAQLAARADGSLIVIGGTTSPSDTYVARFVGDPVPPAAGLLGFDLRYSGALEANGLAVIDVVRTGGSAGTVTVNYAITGGTATVGSDYTDTSGVLTFGPGITSQQIQIPLTVDTVGELAETIELTLTNATGGAQLQYPVQHEVLIFAHNGGFGSIDPNFGVNGLATANHAVPPGSNADLVEVRDKVVLPNGKILVIGQGGFNTVGGSAGDSLEPDAGADFLIARFNADGTPDTDFGDNGKVSTDISFGLDFAESVGLLADGRFIVAGYTFDRQGDIVYNGDDENGFGGFTERLAFVRYLPNGAIDRTYGVDGIVTFDPRTLPGRTGVVTEVVFEDYVILPGGDIVAGINVRDYSEGVPIAGPAAAALIRFDAEGNFDLSFGGDGLAETGLTSSSNSNIVLAQQPDGKFVLAFGPGDFREPLEERTALARFNSNGTLDTTFGTKGTVVFDLFLGVESPEIPRSIAFQQDGKILLSGQIDTLGADGESDPDLTARDPRGYVARLTTTGALDTTFSGDGIAFFAGLFPRTSLSPFGVSEGDIYDVAQLPSGRIVAAATSYGGPGADSTRVAYVTLELLADGSVDPQFGINGAFRHTALADSISRTNGAILVTPSNDIVSIFGAKLASGSAGPNDSLFALQRLTTQGAAGRLEWTLGASSVEETDGAASLLVRRIGGTVGAVTVDYSFSSGTATAGADFIGINGTLTFAEGQTLSEIIVPITRGDAPELTETFTATLSNVTGGATLEATTVQTVSILDGPDRFEFASPTFGFLEGSRLVSVPVVRKGAPATGASVDFTLRGLEAVNGVDFDALEGGTLYFAPGQTTATISFALRADDLPEGRESIALALTNPQSGPVLGAVTQATVNIFDTQPGKGRNAGALDPRFDGDGISNADVFAGGTGEQSRDMAVQADGKIVVVGESGGSESDFLVARYLANGALDPSFGSGGVVTTDFFGGVDSARAVALDAQGRIVVAGWALREGRADMAVARYLANGTLDVSFDGDGRATVDFDGFDDRAAALALGGDGRIVLGGVTSGVQKLDTAVAVLTDTGALDVTFSTDGRATQDFDQRGDVGSAILVQADGAILLGGTSSRNVTAGRVSDFIFVRYTAAGALDTTFNSDGSFIAINQADNTTNTTLNAMAFAPDGRVIFAGGVGGDISYGVLNGGKGIAFFTADNFTLAQLGGGPAFTSSTEAITDLAVAADGSFIAAGFTIFPGETQQRLFVKRVLPDFSYDSSFGVGSTSVVTSLAGARAVAFTPTGGVATTGGSFEVAQFLQNSASPPEGSFYLGALSYSVAETAGNQLVQVRRPHGSSVGVVSVDYAVVGITAQAGQDFTPVAGTLTFRESETIKTFSIPILNDAVMEGAELFGIVLTNPTGGAELSSASYAPVVIPANDPQGAKPGGFALSTPDIDDFVFEGLALVTVKRTGGSLGAVTIDYHTEDGTAKAGEDYTPAFGTLSFANGETSKQIFFLTTEDDRVEGAETIYLKFTTPTGGSTLDLGFDTMTLTMGDSVAAETFPYAGNADVTFDTDGRLTTDSGVTGPDNFFAVAQQADGKLVAVGQAGTSGGFFLARYNTDGSLDTTFGTDGKTVTSLGSDDRELALAVRVSPDGKILVLGASGADGVREEIVMARYTATGALDKSFGTQGFTHTQVQAGFVTLSFQQGNGDVAVQADGKFVVATFANNGFDTDLALLRFLPTGKLDTSFGTGGTLTYDVGLVSDFGTSVTVQPDGKIIATFGNGLTRAVRFNVDGSVDTGFGDDGVVRANPAETLLSPGLVITDTATVFESLVLPDGDVLLLGQAYGFGKPVGSPLNFTETLRGGLLMLRFNSDGTPDAAFGTNGVKEVVGTFLGQLADATLDEAGKIVALGGNGFARILADGRADPGFGPNGIGASGFGSALLMQADGRIVIAGGNAFSTGDARLSRFIGGPAAGALRLNVLTEKISEEGGMLVIPIERLAGLDGAVSVTFSTANGTATAGSDYTATTQVLSWANLEDGVKTVSIPITDDLIADANETFTFNLSTPTGGAVLSVRKTGTTTIVDDDQPGVLEFTKVAYLAHENDGTATLTVRRRDGDLGAVSVNYSVTGGTAVDGMDFTLAAGVLNFANGELTKTISVSLIDDAALGEDKTLVVTLATPGGGATLGDVPAARLTIVDNEVPLGGVFGFGSVLLETREDSGGYLVTVLRTGGSNGAATVNLNVAPGTALSGRDFIPFVTTLSLADGQTSASAFIPVFDNADVNPDRTVLLSLDTPTGDLVLTTRTQPTIGSDGAATLSILDNDAFPARISAGSLVLLTGGTAIAGKDFTAAPMLVEFADGELSKTVFVPLRNDLINEPAQTFNVTLASPTGGVSLGVTTAGTVTITDDDTPALRDFNNDGKLDLIAQKGAKLLLHLGDGAGGFAAVGTLLPAVKGVKSYVHGDFNGDGNADLALLTAKSVTLLAGKGDGSFAAPSAFASNKSAKSLVAADFNGDGRLDLAALSAKGLNVLLSNGAGFTAPRFTAVQKALSMVAGDFNEDGRTDLAFVSAGKSKVLTLLNDGSAKFAPRFAGTVFGTGVKPLSLVAADLTGDGHLDLAAIVAKNQIAIAPGNGQGSFGPVRNAGVGLKPTLIALADVDDDLDFDLITTNAKKLAAVLVNSGGTFAAPAMVNVAFTPTFFTACDLNGDEDADIVLATKKDAFKTALGTAGTGFTV